MTDAMHLHDSLPREYRQLVHEFELAPVASLYVRRIPAPDVAKMLTLRRQRAMERLLND